MMLMISNLVYNHLKEFNDANANVLAGEIFPLVAPIDASNPFAVYRVSKETNFSKQGIKDVNVVITLVGDDYEQICGLADDLEAHIETKEGFNYISTEPGVNPDDPNEVNFILTYNLKMV